LRDLDEILGELENNGERVDEFLSAAEKKFELPAPTLVRPFMEQRNNVVFPIVNNLIAERRMDDIDKAIDDVWLLTPEGTIECFHRNNRSLT